MIEKVLLVGLVLCHHSRALQGECEVTGFEMTCRGKNAIHGLPPKKDYSSVDTLNVHHSAIDLTDDFIPRDMNLSHLTLLNATDNEIKRIGSRGFDKIRNVQFLYLSENKISRSQPDPFQTLTKLELLEMENALDGSGEAKAALLRNLFKSKNPFTHLSKIELNRNRLEKIHPNTFCGVQGLRRLELSNNKLESLDFARKCLGELKALFIGSNLIQEIPKDIWDFLPSLSSLDISNNPINCNCETVRLLRDDDVVFINQANTKCASPPELSGTPVFEVPKDYCNGGTAKPSPRGKGSFWQFVALFFVAIGILYGYSKYRQKASGRMSSAPVGYTNLQHEHAVEPEFV